MPSPPPSPAPRPISKAAAAYEYLRRQMRTGALAPGERITLKRLSDELQMSLTPVREALSRLESEGFVVHDPHRGSTVAELTAERIEQVYRLRAELEPLAVEVAVPLLDDADIENLANLVQACDDAETPLDLVENNEAFHFTLYRMSQDQLLISFIDQLWAGMPYPSLGLFGSNTARRSQSSEEHHAILDALRDRDASTASALMRQHVLHGEQAALDNL